MPPSSTYPPTTRQISITIMTVMTTLSRLHGSTVCTSCGGKHTNRRTDAAEYMSILDKLFTADEYQFSEANIEPNDLPLKHVAGRSAGSAWLEQADKAAKELAKQTEALAIVAATKEATRIAAIIRSGSIVYTGKTCKHGKNRLWACKNPAVALKNGMCVAHMWLIRVKK